MKKIMRERGKVMNKKHDIRIDRSKLHPWLDYKLTVLLKKCAKKKLYLIVTEGYRTKEYQDALYAKGRTKPGKIVTNARGSSYSSQHMWGIAFDVAINDPAKLYDEAMLRKVAKIAKSIGLGWGGDWKSITDTPHFYLPKWGSTATILKAKYGTPSKFKKTWTKRVGRDKGLLLWKSANKLTGSYFRIPGHAKVAVLFQKSWYVKVRYRGQVGYVNKKYVK